MAHTGWLPASGKQIADASTCKASVTMQGETAIEKLPAFRSAAPWEQTSRSAAWAVSRARWGTVNDYSCIETHHTMFLPQVGPGDLR